MAYDNPKEPVRDIENSFRASWDNQTPLIEDNMDPADIKGSHVKLTVIFGAKLVSANGQYRRQHGELMVIVRVPRGVSSWDAWDLAFAAGGYLDSITVGAGFQTMSPDYINLGNFGNGDWYQINVIVPFYFSYWKT